MQHDLRIDILPQPDDTTCGPTCLHAVYRYFEDEMPLMSVIQETGKLGEGGTLGVLLGIHALARGYQATIYTYNLRIFDPTWFIAPESTAPPLVPVAINAAAEPTGQAAVSATPADASSSGLPLVNADASAHKDVGEARVDLIDRLRAQMAVKESPRLRTASEAYINFLGQGGQIRMEDLTGDLLRYYLNQSIPILTGLSATYLYAHPREIGATNKPDDIRGRPAGHFVVLTGYDRQLGTVQVADPYLPNPLGPQHHYEVDLDRLVCAILLGVLTYDANLLILEPPGS